MEIFDIAIVGLGVAGACVASLLNSELKVIAIDKKTEDENSFKKPCGGLLSPDAQKALAKLNINLPKDTLVDPQIFYVKTIDNQTKLERNYLRSYINIDRHKFDNFLISTIPKNICLERGYSCKKIEKDNNLFIITYNKGDETKTIAAKNVVGCDGANSKVRKLIATRSPKKLIAIQEWFPSQNENAFYTCIFDKTITKTYSYTITKDNFRIVCAILDTARCVENFDKLKKTLGITVEPLKREACALVFPHKMSDFCMGENNVFLAGEAAGFVSPSSFEGISYAIESAIRLAQTLNSKKVNKAADYKRKTLPLRLKLMRKCVKSAIIFQPFLRKILMKSGIGSVKSIVKPKK